MNAQTITRLLALSGKLNVAFRRALAADDQDRMDALLVRLRAVSAALARVAQASTATA